LTSFIPLGDDYFNQQNTQGQSPQTQQPNSLLPPIVPRPELSIQNVRDQEKTANSFRPLPNDFVGKEYDSTAKSWARTALQVPVATGYVASRAWLLDIAALLNSGEVALKKKGLTKLNEAIEQNPQLNAFFQKYVPNFAKEMINPNNVKRVIPYTSEILENLEKVTGLPLEARTKGQKRVRFATEVGSGTVKEGAKAVAKKVLAATAVKAGSEKLGVPEPFSDIAGILAGGSVSRAAGKAARNVGESTPQLTRKVVKKGTNAPVRNFEKLKRNTKVSEGQYDKIMADVAEDFIEPLKKELSETPIGKGTAKTPRFKEGIKKEIEDIRKLAASEEFKDIKVPVKNIKDRLKADVKKENLARGNFPLQKEYRRMMNKFIGEKDYLPPKRPPRKKLKVRASEPSSWTEESLGKSDQGIAEFKKNLEKFLGKEIFPKKPKEPEKIPNTFSLSDLERIYRATNEERKPIMKIKRGEKVKDLEKTPQERYREKATRQINRAVEAEILKATKHTDFGKRFVTANKAYTDMKNYESLMPRLEGVYGNNKDNKIDFKALENLLSYNGRKEINSLIGKSEGEKMINLLEDLWRMKNQIQYMKRTKLFSSEGSTVKAIISTKFPMTVPFLYGGKGITLLRSWRLGKQKRELAVRKLLKHLKNRNWEEAAEEWKRLPKLLKEKKD